MDTPIFLRLNRRRAIASIVRTASGRQQGRKERTTRCNKKATSCTLALFLTDTITLLSSTTTTLSSTTTLVVVTHFTSLILSALWTFSLFDNSSWVFPALCHRPSWWWCTRQRLLDADDRSFQSPNWRNGVLLVEVGALLLPHHSIPLLPPPYR